MEYRKLGRTGISVSRICLGTMTYGAQNSEAEGHAQMDMAFDHGVNFLDTAEMYSFPRNPETQGNSERAVGSWMKARGNRDKVIVATKITGPGSDLTHIRGGDLKFGRKQIRDAVENSLQRLQTDYIDLYQTHWPERPSNFFGKLGYKHRDRDFTPFEETLAALQELVGEGKIRAAGVSNETPWGLSKMLAMAEADPKLIRMASIQNPYNLLNRTFEVGLAELAIREDCGLLAYSPLGFGALTGKYLDGPPPEGSRMALFPTFQRHFKPNGVKATRAYVDLANRHGIDPAVMALAFVNAQPFLTSNIIGATTLTQLETNLSAEQTVLSDEVLEEIERIHLDNPNPAP